MSKKTEETIEQAAAQEQEQQQEMQPAKEKSVAETGADDYLAKLKATGKANLTAKTREELAEKVANIPADISYGVGAVGYNYDNGLYVIDVFLTKKK